MAFRVVAKSKAGESVWVPVEFGPGWKEGDPVKYYWGVLNGIPKAIGWVEGYLSSCQPPQVQSPLARVKKHVTMCLERFSFFPTVLIDVILEFICVEPVDLVVGDYLDALDEDDVWYSGVVQKREENKMLIKYIGWSCRYNQWYSTSHNHKVNGPRVGSYENPRPLSCLASLGEKTGFYGGVRSEIKKERLILF